jgi:hypothetical protein
VEYRQKTCPFCKKQIFSTAKKCKHCGEWLNEQAKENTQEAAQPQKPLSEKSLGYVLATAGGLFGGPIGLLVSPYVLLLLNRTFKPKNGKQPNRFLAWTLIGIVAAPVCWLPIIPSTPPKTTSHPPEDKKEELLADKNSNAQSTASIRSKTPELVYKAASTVKYSIRQVSTSSWQGRPDEKRIVEVDLSDKASKQTLREISRQIKDGASKQYGYTVISFHLPKEHGDQRDPAWAVVDFPGLLGGKGEEMSVRFNVLTVEEMSALYRAATSYLAKTDAVESWLETGVFPGQIKELVQRSDKTMGMRSLSPGYASSEKDASASEGEKMILAKDARGTKVERKEPNEFGEYYIINPKGDLEYWSKNGHFFTAKNVKNISR